MKMMLPLANSIELYMADYSTGDIWAEQVRSELIGLVKNGARKQLA